MVTTSGASGRIAVDAMGGDLGPAEVVAAVKLALHQYPALNPITLVGHEAELNPSSRTPVSPVNTGFPFFTLPKS